MTFAVKDGTRKDDIKWENLDLERQKHMFSFICGS